MWPRRFGPFVEMLKLSLQKRLRETDPDRERRDTLDRDRAMSALERIGAAMVLQRLRDIEVPEGTAGTAQPFDALQLDDVLPDWSGVDRAKLISRAVFVPSSAGYVRLHNDNDGAVSG